MKMFEKHFVGKNKFRQKCGLKGEQDTAELGANTDANHVCT